MITRDDLSTPLVTKANVTGTDLYQSNNILINYMNK